MQISVPFNLKARVKLKALKKDGTEAPIDGKLIHGASSDPAAATVVEIPESTDGMEFFVVPGDAADLSANLPFSADVLLGPETVSIEGSLDILTTADVAGSFDMTVKFEKK